MLVTYNIFVITILPFVYYMIENVVLSMLNLPYFRMVTALGVISGDYTYGIELWYLLIGPAILASTTIILLLVGLGKKVFFNKPQRIWGLDHAKRDYILKY